MKIIKCALLVLLCLACLPSKSFADSKNLYLSVGDEETITLPYEFTSYDGIGQWVNKDPSAIEISYSMYSVKIKVLKWVYHTCLVEYDYHYTKDGFGHSITYSIFIDIRKPILNLYINNSGGTVPKGYNVELRCSEPDAKIYYTLDGNNPSISSKEYYYGIVIEKSCTLKAFATWGGADSDILTAKYTVEESEQSGLSVSANPSGGSVSKGTTVYLTSSVSGAEIYYTLDGSTPSKSSHYYSTGITINESCTLKAIAYKSGYKESNILTEYYTVDSGSDPSPAEPTSISVSPSSKTINVGDTFTVSYTLSPSDASTTVTWTSDDTSIATVSSSGTVTGQKGGTTYINASTSNGKTSSCKVTVESGSTSKNIAINSTIFPDANFRNYLLDQDYGKDGVITAEEISNVTYIDVDKKEIKNLKGIEYFTALTNLSCEYNQLTELDVSNNVMLKNLYCNNNLLTKLDLSNNTALVKIDFSYNQLSAIDISKNTNITSLDCTQNPISKLDLSTNKKLRILFSQNNGLSKLDLSNNSELRELYCGNNQLTTLDLSKNTALAFLYCYSNLLTSLDISKNTAMIRLACSSNQLTSLDVSKNTALTDLGCSSNQLTSLDVSHNKDLKTIECYRNCIKGSAMDDFIRSLAINNTSDEHNIHIVSNSNYEQNVCTTIQAEAIKAKGWKVYTQSREEYSGSDPSGIKEILLDADEKSPIYDIKGQRLSEPHKGINVIGGKKVVIK